MALGGGLAALIFSPVLALRACPASPAGVRAVAFLKSIDSFALAHALRENQVATNNPTPLGGACTITSLLTYITFSIVLIIRFTSDNVVVTSSIDTASPGAPSPFSAAAAWATGANSLAPELAGSVQLRVFAPLALNCSAPMGSAVMVGAGAGGVWSASSTPDCGDGRSLLTFTCARCALAASTAVSFTLPFTCQALYVEALAYDATGALSTLALPPAQSTGSGALLLGSITWTVNVMAAVLVNSVTGRSARGFRLLDGPATPTLALPPGGVLQPLPAAVKVTIALPLMSTYSVTTVAQKMTYAELLSSILGLAGVMSAFRVLFQLAESAMARGARARSQPPLSADFAPSKTGGSEESDGMSVAVQNPLASSGSGRLDPTAPPDIWCRRSDSTDVWFVNKATGESAWHAPDNSIIEDT